MISAENEKIIKDNWDIFPYQLDYVVYHILKLKEYAVKEIRLDLNATHIKGVIDHTEMFELSQFSNTIKELMDLSDDDFDLPKNVIYKSKILLLNLLKNIKIRIQIIQTVNNQIAINVIYKDNMNYIVEQELLDIWRLNIKLKNELVINKHINNKKL